MAVYNLDQSNKLPIPELADAPEDLRCKVARVLDTLALLAGAGEVSAGEVPLAEVPLAEGTAAKESTATGGATNRQPGIVVAFSGGVDSTLLLELAMRAAGAVGNAKAARFRVTAMTCDSAFVAPGQTRAAQRYCEMRGVRFVPLAVDMERVGGLMNNPPNRCYLCKRHLFAQMLDEASSQSLGRVVDGTNLDDTFEHRPGLAALSELGVASPLAQAELTKAEIRQVARLLGLACADAPSSPCLATRFAYGAALTEQALAQVATAEDFLHDLRLNNVRVRSSQDRNGCVAARIEVDAVSITRLVQPEIRAAVVARFKALGFTYVSLDLEGFRSGSMDAGAKLLMD